MKIREAQSDRDVLERLIRMSEQWEAENSCHGYRANREEDIAGNRIFVAEDEGKIIGYLFGHSAGSEKQTSIIPDGTPCFEIMEIYVEKEYRSRGIGRKLFAFVQDCIEDEYITLSTATRDWKAILHFYIEELDMSFHSARLFKRIKKDGVSR